MENKKMPLNSPLQRKVSLSKVSASDGIATPEKPAQLPRRASKRRLSFSVGGERKVAMGLQMTRNKSANPSDVPRSDGELQRKSQSSSDSAAARKTTKLSENYEMLAEFFNCLDSSVRLLRLKGSLSTFTNISASIQHLTERRFTYRHLAQMKHILPEAISIKKVLLHDEATCCMKPELQVSLQVDAVERNLELKGESPYSALRMVFRDRLVQFAREHPEEDDIPEETLPHPFGRTNPSMSTEFNRSLSVAHPGKRPLVIHDQHIEEDSMISAQNNISSEVKSLESTPVKDIASSARLMITTPNLQTPKRSRISSINDTQKALVKQATRTKLFPTPRKIVQSGGEDNLSESSPVEDDVLGFLPESFLQDIRDKEKNAMEERHADVAGARSRKKIIESLPKLFDLVLLIFQSGNRFVITKQELVHKILSCNCSVIDRNEVEEQLELMEELVPDWIFRKAAATGDILYRVNKMSSSQEIRQRLALS
ncbi:CDT1-like protein a, chloroplastic [Dendrobium catenatum]|uniref:CDT1-like protein a, chloroplastic n=1 Tax=Dendrobium catenatum TaxID=906689 RepID=UPI00109F501C|nr:CDT1-like protein a, chloroplastic [Dendrobium catenatum]XP_028554275.1 CDT1-like protein a, chloroplastic [Dendrobium catenatum]